MADLAPDVAIVGGGIAGGVLATMLAKNGLDVVVLERETTYPDRVRGEYMPPWGVLEFKRLGLLDILYENGGLHVERNIPYDENWSPEVAEARALDVSKLLPDVAGPLCIGHPTMCNAFSISARAAGAKVLNDIKNVEVTAGNRPTVSFVSDGSPIQLKPRLVIGADGRNSTVRKQLGLPVLADEPHNLIGGMLVANVPDFPRNIQTMGTEGRLHYLIFPQGNDLVRLYAAYDFSDRASFAGPDREARLLQAFRLKCLPYAQAVLAGTPIGPFHSFSNEDHWVDDPTAPGVVLVGDAAGHNDPITGQGVSIAARDARIVSDILISNKNWNQADFLPYVEERRERMRRLRIAARLATKLRVEFGEEARARRARVAERMRDRQLSPLPVSLVGPERLPNEAFLPETIEKLIA
ncbi:FAD-dependent monooxygenase [Bradyrhizobium sp. INPA01-394B]|uniref:FAD-dependent monooxygenase n=1 Tax=Bradyrhizobium campsiandrae TaxID=1729892 RepID=A0ABR7U2S1_9BRAD|nr:NAD(P)/FAD-dependent oxidoreductase [Bradyrhizobium campsiandrae]MBC9877990.1 FAD-dependent monooxygenase [Bradyrhizobium campsiandrae]MBC9978334.1 FAD-dependent monooxygenase [Bradyrhizobium campsiandrae]